MAAPLLLAGLGRIPFDDPGEGMHAEIARELAVSRDPFALTLNGVRYVDKPPLLYVLIALASAVAGPSEATARAVSAAAAAVAIGATAWLGAHLLGWRGGLARPSPSAPPRGSARTSSAGAAGWWRASRS